MVWELGMWIVGITFTIVSSFITIVFLYNRSDAKKQMKIITQQKSKCFYCGRKPNDDEPVNIDTKIMKMWCKNCEPNELESKN